MGKFGVVREGEKRNDACLPIRLENDMADKEGGKEKSRLLAHPP